MEEVLYSKDMIVIAVFVRNFEAANVFGKFSLLLDSSYLLTTYTW